MISALVDWIASLPALAIYAILGTLGTLENVFPPLPADTVIALGAFLSHRGAISATAVFAVTLIMNLAGAMGVYAVASRHSGALFDSSLGRRLLPPDGVEFVRKEYRRFGLLGLFIARLLPGFRAIVPPFAGLIHLPPLRVALVMGLASGLWYGAIIFIASRLGEHWGDVTTLLGHLNSGLAIATLLVVAGLGIWIWRRRRSTAP